jgi:hypothetical protein
MMATKLNAQVIIKNLQNMHEKSLPPTGARRRMELAYQDWARLQRQGTTHGRTFRPHHRVAVVVDIYIVVEPWDGQDPPADSTYLIGSRGQVEFDKS